MQGRPETVIVVAFRSGMDTRSFISSKGAGSARGVAETQIGIGFKCASKPLLSGRDDFPDQHGNFPTYPASPIHYKPNTPKLDLGSCGQRALGCRSDVGAD